MQNVKKILFYLNLFKEFVLENVHGKKSENPGYGNQANIFMKLIQPEAEQLTVIQPGIGIDNLSGAADSMTYYCLSIPPGIHGTRHIRIFGGTGDCDLYVRHGSRPTLTEWNYCPYMEGNNEPVTLTDPAPGDWFIMLHGYQAYSGVTLIAE